MQLFGHRGGSVVCPENTAQSFEWALQRGSAGVECDLQQLADGTIVVLHDDTLRRTAEDGTPEALLDVPVAQLRWEDVRDVWVGGGQTLLTFDAFLALIAAHGGARCLVELKGGDSAIIDAAAEVALARAALPFGERIGPDCVIFIGFDMEVMLAMKRRLPAYRSYLVVDPCTVAEKLRQIASCKAGGLDGVDFCAQPADFDASVMGAAAEAGLDVGVWVWRKHPETDTRASWDAFTELGITFFTSDLPPEIFSWQKSASSGAGIENETEAVVWDAWAPAPVAMCAASAVAAAAVLLSAAA